VVAAVGGQAEVLLDGGIRRGGDVVKALALGARAVMIGRACLWGLAAGGPAGVRNVFDILHAGIDSALLALGRPSVHDLTPADVIFPEDFTHGPNGPAVSPWDPLIGDLAGPAGRLGCPFAQREGGRPKAQGPEEN
jgi:hypothetical protein